MAGWIKRQLTVITGERTEEREDGQMSGMYPNPR